MSKKKNNKVPFKTGTGLIGKYFSLEGKIGLIDVSGIDTLGFIGDNQCYRNDASILWIVAQSYANNCKNLLESINKKFEEHNSNGLYFIIPYFFSYRHFIEVSLKAITLWASHSEYEITHDLSKLLEQAEKAINNITDRVDIWNSNITIKKVKKFQRKTQKNLSKLKLIVTEFNKSEPAADYYRFIFETTNEIKQTKIVFKYDDEYNNFSQTYKIIYNIVINLSYIVYVFNASL